MAKSIRPRKQGSSEKLFKYLSVQPTSLILVIVVMFPFLYAVYLSFTNARVANFRHPQFTFFLEYLDSLATWPMWAALGRSLLYVVVTVSLETTIGMLIALGIRKTGFLRRLFVVLFILPMLISPVLVGIMFRLEGNYSFGIIQYFAKHLLPGLPPLFGPELAFPSMMMIDIWQWTSFMFLIIYAGLQALPQDPYEAASVDGATPWQTFWTVTLPLLRPVLIIALLFRIMDSFKAFDHINFLTGGGPFNRTTTISVLIYKTAFEYDRLGQACAMSVIFLVIINVIVKRIVIYFPKYGERVAQEKKNKQLAKEMRKNSQISTTREHASKK